ncbi:tryptophan 7-halogenase [Nannocystis bainbridge]|uniref:Tryptophan 7-halogenase n=1 Tax=Nannocystis bainbridge TaxID=2995303 RepID=A0ABT5ECH0_9BACT|nr:tryptophan 7-halogenase [Nannocystis bainbridge]MDC0723552.1 tryptophan 7-halogenase [Nannocystis bainbridge]
MSEVAVIGAGPAGALAAGLLARAGLAVTLIDPRPEGFRIGEGLPPAARPLLQALGLLPLGGTLPGHGTLSAWGSDDLGVYDHIGGPYGPGWILDRARFDDGLRRWACEGGAVLRIARLVGAAPRGDEALELRLDDGTLLVPAFAIDASGRPAVLAHRLGATRTCIDALVATYIRCRPGVPGDRDTRVLVEAAAYGWWYTVRVPSGERVVALLRDHAPGSSSARAEFESQLRSTRFVAATLAAHAYQPLEAPRGADARTGRLSHVFGDRWLAVGDAAFSVDPLSSQGLVDALLTADAAAKAVVAALDGDRGRLPAYGEHACRLYERYLEHRSATYARERRWPDAPFWQRRHGPP